MKELVQIKEYLREGTLVSRSNTLVGGILGAMAHFFFYFIFKFGFHLPYENFWLRLSATLMCIGIMFMHKLPDSFRPFFPYIWHFFLIFVLPFIFTVNLIMNNFHELWLYWEIFMIFILMMFVPNWLIFLFDFLVGVTAAILFWLIFYPSHHLHPDFNIPLYSIVVSFSIFAGYIFSFSNWKSMKDLEQQKAEEKYRALEAQAGSIAHEMRNPLSQIKHNLDEILLQLSQNTTENEAVQFRSGHIDSIIKRVTQTQMAVNRGLHVINMTLSNFRTDVTKNDLTCLSATAITRKAIEEYGYASEEERQMVWFDLEEEFMLLGEEDNFTLVLYNLLVNALHVLQSAQNGKVEIRLEKGEQFNKIIVRDNGPGISQENLSKIFEPFFTRGKKGGTGLGLAFCKRVMQSFHGDITCSSEKNKFTEFTLTFPVVDQALISQYEAKIYEEYTPFFSGKHLVLATDKPEQRTKVHNLMAPLKTDIIDVSDGKAVFDSVTKRCDLLLIDSELSALNFRALMQKLKANGNDVPVVTILTSSLSLPDYGNRTSEGKLLMPLTLHELLSTLKITIETSRSTLKSSLTGKTVLIVDDLDFNRKVIRSMLGKLGLNIFEAPNGLEALKILDQQPQVDLLIMDMRMPVLDGFETAKRLRSTPSHYRSIPILGLSGNLDNTSIKVAEECGINDSLIKPVKLKPFLQKVTSMLIEHPQSK